MATKRYGQACPVARSLELVGERWTLLIVRDLLHGPGRFQDLRRSLPGIAPNLLSERLKLMEQAGLVSRRFYSDYPPRAEYVLTDRGRELGLVVGALADWGGRHLRPGRALVNEACGHAVRLLYYCPQCATPVRGSGVSLVRTGSTPKTASKGSGGSAPARGRSTSGRGRASRARTAVAPRGATHGGSTEAPPVRARKRPPPRRPASGALPSPQ